MHFFFSLFLFPNFWKVCKFLLTFIFASNLVLCIFSQLFHHKITRNTVAISIEIHTKKKKRQENLPASNIRPISSFLPILSKSMTITSNEHSLIFSHGTLKEKASLNIGLRVHLKIGVLRFSILLSPNWSQTLT